MRACGEFELIMAVAPLRFVTQCSCTAVHTQWDDWGLQIMPLEFQALVRALNRRVELDGPNETPFVIERENNTLFALSLEHSDRYRIWYGGCALELDGDDLALMHGMLQAAVDRLNTKPQLHPQLQHELSLN